MIKNKKMAKNKKEDKRPSAILDVAPTKGDKVFDVINAVIMVLLCIIIVYPLYYVVLASMTDPKVVNTGKLLFYPEAPYFKGYAEAFQYPQLLSGYKNTICSVFFDKNPRKLQRLWRKMHKRYAAGTDLRYHDVPEHDFRFRAEEYRPIITLEEDATP